MFIGSANIFNSYNHKVAVQGALGGGPVDPFANPLSFESSNIYMQTLTTETVVTDPNNPDNFTAAGWFYIPNLPSTGEFNLVSFAPFAGQVSRLYVTNGWLKFEHPTFSGSVVYPQAVSFSTTNPRWVHIAYSFESTNNAASDTRIFVNGALLMKRSSGSDSLTRMPEFSIQTCQIRGPQSGIICNHLCLYNFRFGTAYAVEHYNNGCADVDYTDATQFPLTAPKLTEWWRMGNGVAEGTSAPDDDNHDYTGVIPFATYKFYSQAGTGMRMTSSTGIVSPVTNLIQDSPGCP